MSRFFILIIVVLIAAGMAVTQHFALLYYWYWTYWWLDILMHCAGGVVIGLLTAAFVTRRLLFVVLAGLVVGVAWEVFEFIIGISLREPNFVFDTSLDLLLDVIGAIAAYGIIVLWRASPLPLSEEHGVSRGQTSSLP